jgi:DNA-binding NtrC family response regulator
VAVAGAAEQDHVQTGDGVGAGVGHRGEGRRWRAVGGLAGAREEHQASTRGRRRAGAERRGESRRREGAGERGAAQGGEAGLGEVACASRGVRFAWARDVEAIGVEVTRPLPGPGGPKDPARAGGPGHHGAAQEALEVERRVEADPTQGPEPAQDAPQRADPGRGAPDAAAVEDDDSVQGRMPLEEGRGLGFDDPGQLGPREGRSEGLQGGEGMDHVAHGAEANQEQLHIHYTTRREEPVTPEEALEGLAAVVAAVREAQEPMAARQSVLALALSATRAQRGFLAHVDGDGLRVLEAFDAAGEAVDVPARQLQRVANGVREALDGVDPAPATMTGGRPPRGAVGVKAGAGQPPVHALPLLNPVDEALEGVLGLVPDPTAPAEPGPTADAVLAVLRGILDPWLLDHGVPRGPSGAEGGSETPSFKHDYGTFVTRSPKMFSVFRKLDRVIGATVPVLITGETGTGKELVARALHDNDPKRRTRLFYSQNCGALTASLLESELFGYVAGAFTGAEDRKLGLFEIASGSTLFLDEIGETSLEMQTRLLRVLQEGELTPVGSTEPVKVDVRLVAATHRDLERAVSEGSFRQDLYYRLKVVRLHLPPLRERPEDVALLVEHFLRKAAREMGRRAKVIDRRDPRILEAFSGYAWPGNVRELENVVRRLAYLADDVITFDALQEHEGQMFGREPSEGPAPRAVRPLDDVVEEVERGEIENALRHTEGNRSRAAELLGINRRSLLRRLKKYGIAGGTD